MEGRMEKLIWVLVGLVLTAIAVVVVVSLLLGGGYGSGSYGPYYGMMGGYGYYGLGLVMPIVAVLSAVFVIVFIYIIIEVARRPSVEYTAAAGANAEETAKLRLARGEISQEEYGRIIEAIRK